MTTKLFTGKTARNMGVQNTAQSNLIRSAEMHDRPRLRGLWNYRCLAPLRVSDPEKMQSLFMLPAAAVARLNAGAIIADKAVRQLVAQYHADKGLLRELERMLFGGGLRWADGYENLIVNDGLDHALDVILSGGTQDTSWFVGLLAASPSPAAGWDADDIASNDFVAYDEATLEAFADGGVSGQSLDNSGSPAEFTISTDSSSIGGAYLIGTNAKATPAGTLFSAGAFTGGNKAADDGDTLEVTITYTAADA